MGLLAFYICAMTDPTQSDGSSEQPMLRACRSILRPLVKAMIAHGMTLPTLVGLLKEIFVEVAEKEFSLKGRRLTDSRISILTGVHRKNVREIRQQGARPGQSARAGVAPTVVGRWLGDPRYRDQFGRPRTLPRLASEKAALSFEGLVLEVSTDIRARTVLDELLRQGLVEIDERHDQVRLLAEAFVPKAGSDAQFDFYRLNLHDHVAAATDNLLTKDNAPPFFERAMYYDELDRGSVEALQQEANAQGLTMLQDLNAKALLRQQDDRGKPGARHRIRVGVYVYHTQQSDDADTDDADTQPTAQTEQVKGES